MGKNIGNYTLAQVHKGLLNVDNDSGGIDATLRTVNDGEGTESALKLSVDKLQVRPASNGTDTFEVVNSSGSVIFQINTTNNKVVLPSGVTIEGDGSALTGVLSAGAGGASSTGNLEVQADSDSSGSGDIIFKIGTKEVARIPYSYASSLPTGVAGNYFIKTIADNWGQPFGGAKLDGVDDYYTVADNDNLDMGLSDCSFEYYGNLHSSSATRQFLMSKRAGTDTGYGWDLRASDSSTDIALRVLDASAIAFTETVNNVVSPNELVHIIITFDRDGNLTTYINKVLRQSTDRSSFSAITLSNSQSFNIGTISNSTAVCSDSKPMICRLWNRALSQSEVTALYNNGQPQLASLPYADLGASQTALTSGTLTIGKRYIIDTFVAGDNFTNVGASSNASGVSFVATGTTPTTWTNSSSLRSIGCVAEWKNFGRLGAVETQNGLHASSSGSPISLEAEQRPLKYRDVKLSIANTATALTNIVPKGYRIASIRAKGSASLTGVKIGTSSGGEQVVASTTAGTTASLLTLAATANAGYSETASVTLYAEHATAAQTLNLIFEFEKVAN